MTGRGTAGGSAGAGGYNFQAAAIALAYAHALAGRPLNWARGARCVPRAISAETGGPGDDIRIECQDGTVVEVQVKKGLSRGPRLWDALLGMGWGLAAEASLRGVLLVDSTSSSPVKDDLHEDIPRIASGRTDGLREISRDLLKRLEGAGVADIEALSRLAVVVRNLDEGSEGHENALTLLGGVADDPFEAWGVLERDAHSLMEYRGRRTAEELRKLVGARAGGSAPATPAGLRLALPAEDLRPEDLGFQPVEPCEEPDRRRRPFHSVYVSRTASERPSGPGAGVPRAYDEEGLAERLRAGEGFVLLGQPLDGKSRTLYEVLRKLPGRFVVSPARGRGLRVGEALARLVTGREVVLLLEDLNDYVAAGYPLRDLLEELERHAAGVVIAATCRDGPELRQTEEKLGRLYEDLLKLKLLPPTAEEKGRLALGIGADWEPEKADEYPTLGSIAMERPMEAMALRFRNLLLELPAHADVLRAMKLLTAASVQPLTHRRTETVLRRVFDRSDPPLRDSLRALAEQSFLQWDASGDGTVRPEPAYLRDAVSYTEGKEPKDDFFPELLYALKDIDDADAMISLGVSSMVSGRYNAQGVYECFHWATEADPNNSSAWLNKTALLSAGGYHEDAVEAAERAVRLKPNNHSYWQQKGTALRNAGRDEEAKDAYLRSVELMPDKPSTWRSLGSVYADLDRPRYALMAFNRSIDLGADYGYLEGWILRARTLSGLGRDRQALRAYDRVTAMDPDHFEARFNKAGLLRAMARWEEALAAAEEAERLRPDHAEVQNGKGEALSRMAERDGDPERFRRALEAYERATVLDKENAVAWSMKGVTLLRLGRYAEALEAVERAMGLRPDRPEEWFHKAQALLMIDKGAPVPAPAEYAAGMWWLCRAWRAREWFPDGGAAVWIAMRQLGYDPRRCGRDYPSLRLLTYLQAG